jgi:uncharacterized protein YjbJ (UPF0337 family)
MGDKIKNKADELLGKGKETAGETANNNELRREGQADQAETGMKQTGENVKDRFKKN